MRSQEFATRFLHEGKVVVVSGTAFGASGEGFLRISYAYSMEKLKIVIDRLEKYIKRLRITNIVYKNFINFSIDKS